MCTHTQRHKQSILCLVTRWAMLVLLLPPSRAAHSGHKVVPCLYHRTQTASRSTQHFLSMLSLCWSSHCIFMPCPKVTHWDCPTPLSRSSSSLFIWLHPGHVRAPPGSAPGADFAARSKLSVALSVPGVYSNLGLVLCAGLPLPHHMGP